jgi:hypothetical protein
MSFVLAPALAETVTWIKVEKPVFDLVGVVLYSLGLAGLCAGIALALGIALGVSFIVRARRSPAGDTPAVLLHLGPEA